MSGFKPASRPEVDRNTSWLIRRGGKVPSSIKLRHVRVETVIFMKNDLWASETLLSLYCCALLSTLSLHSAR